MTDRIAELESLVKQARQDRQWRNSRTMSFWRRLIDNLDYLLTQLREREEALYMAKEALDTIPERPSPDRYGSDAVIHLYHKSLFWELKRKALAHPAMRAGKEE